MEDETQEPQGNHTTSGSGRADDPKIKPKDADNQDPVKRSAQATERGPSVPFSATGPRRLLAFQSETSQILLKNQQAFERVFTFSLKLDSSMQRPFLPILSSGKFPAFSGDLEQIGKMISSNFAATKLLSSTFRPPTFPRLSRVLERHQEALRQLTKGLSEQLRAGTPPNWEFQDDWPRLETIAKVVEDDGIPLAWVPRADIVRALVHTNGLGPRRSILAERENEILEDCHVCLDGVGCRELSEFVDNARESVRALQDGHARASQALATVVLDASLRLLFGDPKFDYRQVRDELRDIWDSSPLRDMRSALVLAGIPGALEQFWPDRGDPIPARFNRHASIHTIHLVLRSSIWL